MFASVAVLVLTCLLMNGNPEKIQKSQGIPNVGGERHAPTQTNPESDGVAESPSETEVLSDIAVFNKSRFEKFYEPDLPEEYNSPNESTSQTTNQTNSQETYQTFNLTQSSSRKETGEASQAQNQSKDGDDIGGHNKNFGQKIQGNATQGRYENSGSKGAGQAEGGLRVPVSSFTSKDPSSQVGREIYMPDATTDRPIDRETTDASGTVSIDTTPGESKEIENDNLPWQVSVFSKDFEPFRRICGGSMVSTSAVISAAHCYWQESDKRLLPASRFAVGAGEVLKYRQDDYRNHRQQNDVGAIKVPPSFSSETSGFQADIAVVLLAYPFYNSNGMRPVCVSFSRLEEWQLIAGNVALTLGVSYLQQEKRTHLQLLKVPYIPFKDCQAALGRDATYLTEDKICAGPKPLNQTLRDMCSQDPGAGLAFYLGDAQDQAKGIAVPFLRGVASRSRAPHPCDVHTPTFYTRLSAHRGFLEEHLGGLEEECGKYYPQLGAFLEKKETRGDANSTEFVCNCFC